MTTLPTTGDRVRTTCGSTGVVLSVAPLTGRVEVERDRADPGEPWSVVWLDAYDVTVLPRLEAGDRVMRERTGDVGTVTAMSDDPSRCYVLWDSALDLGTDMTPRAYVRTADLTKLPHPVRLDDDEDGPDTRLPPLHILAAAAGFVLLAVGPFVLAWLR